MVETIERFIEMLVYIAGFSVMIFVALKGVFDTKLYKIWFGDGLDGSGSKIFRTWELRPWISMGVGIVIANCLNLNIFSFLLGLDDVTFFLAMAGMEKVGLSRILSFSGTIMLCNILTGIVIGSGPKAIIEASKLFGEAKDAILKNIRGEKKDE